MLKRLRRWWRARRGGRPGRPEALLAWGEARGARAAPWPQGEGWGLRGEHEGCPWQAGWGRWTRGHPAGPGLRLRLNLGLPVGLQLLVCEQGLAESLEQGAFSRSTESAQTVLDTDMPEEQRWLALFPKPVLPALQTLRGRYCAVGPAAPPLGAWLDGPLAEALGAASTRWLEPEDALLILVQRGWLELRLAGPPPEADRLQAAWVLALLAAGRARAVAAELAAQEA